jgi:hypothetical protein
MSLNADAGAIGSTITVDAIYVALFVDLPPKIKEAITQEACQIFQRRYKGSAQSDQWLADEAGRTQAVSAQPTTSVKANAGLNPTPLPMIPPPQR